MKKISFILAALLATSVISCQREIDIQDNVNPEELENVEQLQEMTFYANTDVSEGETKTVLDLSNDHVINWAADETIYVFDGTAPRSFTNGSSTGSSNVPFTGMALPGASKYYALFPSGYFVKGVGDPTIKADIPVSQRATANSFDPNANVSIAVAADVDGLSSLSFKNVGAVVKFTLKTAGVRRVVLEPRGTEDIAGEVSITLDGSNIPTASVTSGSKFVILDGGASDLSVDTPYYITVLPGTYASGFKITFEKSDGKFRSFSDKVSETLSRGGMMNFGEFTITSFKEVVKDELTLSTTGRQSGSSYGNWSDKTISSTAVYAGNNAGGNSAIQLRSSSNSGIITTGSGGKVRKIEVEWNSNTSADRTLDVYVKNTAYSATSDLYATATQGTKIGSIVYGTSTELTIPGAYEYIAFRSKSSALYLNKVIITWGTGSTTSVTPEVTLTNVTNASLTEEGGTGSFIINSNVHWTLDYTPDGNSGDVTYASTVVDGKTKINVTFPSMTGAAGDSRSVEFTVTPEGGSPVSQSFTQTVRPTITWNSNGSTSTTRQSAGEKLVLPDDPTLSGYTFLGWTAATTVSSDGDGITWTTASTDVPAADITYYAVYKLAAPSNIDDDGDELSWDAVTSAVKYIVTIEGEEPVEVNTNSYDFSSLSLTDGVYNVTVVAVPAAANLFVQSTAGNYSLTIGSVTTYTVSIGSHTNGSITVNGSSSAISAEPGDEITIVATPDNTYKFSSWSVTGATPASTTSATTTFTMPAGNVTVACTFAAKEWVKVTDASTLAAGQQIMLVATVSGASTSANNGTFAANGTISSDVMGKVSATITSNKLTSYTGAQIFTLGKSGSNWTLSNGSSLLGATANKKIAWGSGTTTWTISISNGVATIDNTNNNNYGKIKYNRDSPRFTTYTGDFSASMAGPMIFRYEQDGTLIIFHHVAATIPQVTVSCCFFYIFCRVCT